LWGENYIRKGEAPPPEISREGSNPSPGILPWENRNGKRGYRGKNCPLCFSSYPLPIIFPLPFVALATCFRHGERGLW